MANYKGHLVGGAVAFSLLFLMIATFVQSSIYVAGEWLIFSLLGSLFPDIDTKSKGQKIFFLIIGIIFLFFIYHRQFDIAVLIASIAITPLLVKHRGIFHTWWFVLGLPLCIAFISCALFPDCKLIILYDALFFEAGAFSHLFLDRGFRMFR